ncbi:MAG: hypothetical protein Q9218_000711 [Villophora microphyllina]
MLSHQRNNWKVSYKARKLLQTFKVGIHKATVFEDQNRNWVFESKLELGSVPTMTRKKKSLPKPKRVELTDSDGWTHIIKGLKNTQLNNASFSDDTKIQSASIPSRQTLTDLRKLHAQYRSQWLSSPCCHQIRKLFLQEILPSLDTSTGEKKKIDRCVVLGLGSLSNGRRSSWWEVVFLENVLSLLWPALDSLSSRQEGTTPIKVLVQDPVLNAVDHSFFSSLGYTVLADPLAFDEITETTFLFAPHLELDVYAKALSGAQPIMCVGTDLKECIEKVTTRSRQGGREKDREGKSEEKGVFQKYINATMSKSLPEFERDEWMYFTCIYLKQPDDNEDT